MSKPKVSILLPAYNHEKYLPETIESVLNQTFSDFELLISDDCSTDNTAQVIRDVSDERVYGVFFDENRGTVRALNYLLSIAKGEYIAVIGSDDVWESEKLEKQLEILEHDKKISACFTWATIINEKSEVLADESTFPVQAFNYDSSDRAKLLKEFFVKGNRLCHSSVLIRKDVHHLIGEYNPIYRQLHDYDLWVRLLLEHEIYIMESKLVRYRFIENSGNVSQNCEKNNFRMWNEAEEILMYLVENISDHDFIKTFGEEFSGREVVTPAQIVCEKYQLLRKYKLWGANNNSLAMRYLFNHIDCEVLTCLKENYEISLNDIYEQTSSFKSAYYADLYEQCSELRKQLQEQQYNFKKQLEEIYASSSWRLTKPIRIIKDKIKKK